MCMCMCIFVVVKVYDMCFWLKIIVSFLSIFSSVEFLGLLQVTKERVLEAIQGHVLGEAVLMAIF